MGSSDAGGSASRQLDVAIVGAGMAGSLLARQLQRSAPGLSIGLFERSESTSYKVGEATVEIAANYLVRKQGLAQYLYENHLPKNGLRYFFDTPERDLTLEAMSEVGSLSLPFHPAFQLDRARFERDLLQMNERAGVSISVGAAVRNIRFGDGGEPHRFEVSQAGRTTAYESRWIVDASGRTGLFARMKGLRVPEKEHRLGSVWGRFEGVADIDSLGSEGFRARVRHTSRRLSTIHFWYPGYWVWFIPLRGGLTSIGVTGEGISERSDLRTEEGFREFLMSHRAIGELIVDAKNVDLGSYTQIAYGTSRFFHSDRWALVGESATAADPLYSPGGDFIALENDYVTDLICRDLVEGDSAGMAERCEVYDQFMQFRHEAALSLYRDLYSCHGSFEVACMKWDFDIGAYYNLWVSPYLLDQHLELEYLRTQLRLKPFVLKSMEKFAKLFRDVEVRLRADGHYYRSNAGQFYYGLTNIPFAEEIGTERSEEAVMASTLDVFNCVRAQALVLLGRASNPDEVEPLPLPAFFGRRELA